MAQTKTDNHNPGAKLELRRYFLNRYHQTGERNVFDACQAAGRLWHQLGQEFKLDTYWGVDVKPKKGRLMVDSVRVLDQPGWTQNVVDVDAYGSPWKHWFAILKHCDHAVTVFLTIGLVKIGGGNLDRSLLPALGIWFEQDMPSGLAAKLNEAGAMHALFFRSAHGLQPVEIQEALNEGGNARYIGIRLETPSGAGQKT